MKFNYDERQARAWIYSSSRHVERTNSRRTVNERLQTINKRLQAQIDGLVNCKHTIKLYEEKMRMEN